METLRVFGLWYVVALAGCGSDSVTKATLGEAAVLRVGQSVEVPSEALRLGVSAVPEDSRCPEGFVCVWAGVATVVVWVEKGSQQRQELLLSTGKFAGHSSLAEYLGYEIELIQVEPPKSGTIQQSDYRVTLVVRAK
jgi:hypothetical protein